MSSAGPIIGKEDQFERRYTDKFRALVSGEGLFVQYEQDRAALDLGVHLTHPAGEQRRVSHARIWFQLKGIHATTLSLEEYHRATSVSFSLPLQHLKFWFASPEPVYLALYVEAADQFVVEDVREIVYRRWGEEFFFARNVCRRAERSHSHAAHSFSSDARAFGRHATPSVDSNRWPVLSRAPTRSSVGPAEMCP